MTKLEMDIAVTVGIFLFSLILNVIGRLYNKKPVIVVSLCIALASTITLIGLVAFISAGLSASFFLLLIAAILWYFGDAKSNNKVAGIGIGLAIVSLVAVFYFII